MESKMAAAAAAAKILVFLLLSYLCMAENTSFDKCKASDLKITQSAAPGPAVGGRHAYVVTVENLCVCMQGDVKVECRGFNSSVHVTPPGFLSADGGSGICTLHGGRRISGGLKNAVAFSYSWSSPFSLKPVSSTLACSVPDASATATAPFQMEF